MGKRDGKESLRGTVKTFPQKAGRYFRSSFLWNCLIFYLPDRFISRAKPAKKMPDPKRRIVEGSGNGVILSRNGFGNFKCPAATQASIPLEGPGDITRASQLRKIELISQCAIQCIFGGWCEIRFFSKSKVPGVIFDATSVRPTPPPDWFAVSSLVTSTVSWFWDRSKSEYWKNEKSSYSVPVLVSIMLSFRVAVWLPRAPPRSS